VTCAVAHLKGFSMAEIKPFSGIRYNPSIVPDLAAVVAPPYDVLSKAEVDEYHARNEYSIVHLTRPVGDDPYAHSAELLREWIAKGVLVADDELSLYVYTQSFSDPETGRKVPERLGLICALKLEDYSSGKVIPHENTITAHRADRLKLLTATEANIESIYGLYADPDREVESFICECGDRSPVVEIVGSVAGSTHKLERISDENAVNVIADMLRDKPVFIADGHHRYETSLAYRAQAGGNPEADYIVITLTAFEDDGLIVLPTHRLVKHVEPAVLAELPAHLSASGFTVTKIEKSAVLKSAPHQDGFIAVIGQDAYDVRPAEGVDIVDYVPGEKSRALKALNVTILSAIALEQGLGIPIESLATTDKVTYTRDAKEAVAKVDNGDVQAAFLLLRPTVEDVQAVAAEHEKMPQKSTFFFPKLLSGLVIRDLKQA
jgi:uncharacterized protein (DUF1015 family)